MASKSNLSVVIDIGTSKLVALAGMVTDEGKMEILGIAKAPSKGIKRGRIFNLADVTESLTQLLTLLDEQLEDEINVVDVAYAGKHMRTIDYSAERYTGEGGVISNLDIDELYNEAKNVKLPEGLKTIKVIPTSFIIDDEIEELKPVGVTGKKIEARYKLVLMPETDLLNLRRVFEGLGVELGNVHHASLAIAEAVLPKHEKEMGTVVLDLGAGTSNLAVYYNNVLCHTAVIPFAGEVITNDLKSGCATFLEKAELLKVKYGQALGDQIKTEDRVTIAKNNGWEPKAISIRSLAYIIQARLGEIVECVNSEIEKSGVADKLGTGIVLSGGTSRLPHIITLIKYHTGMDARMANSIIHPVNRKDDIKNPEIFTALGALKLTMSSTDVPLRVIPKPPKNAGAKTIWNPFKGAFQGALSLFDEGEDDLEFK